MPVSVMLGGIALDIYAGAPEQAEEPIGGSTVLRMSDGSAVKLTHWRKMGGVLTGQGLMPAGLDGLDYSLPLELRSTQVTSMTGAGPAFTLSSTPRPDMAPWAFARVDGHWRRTPCSLLAGVVTVTPQPSADLYQVHWMPVYSVFAEPPSRGQSTRHTWSLTWEEV